MTLKKRIRLLCVLSVFLFGPVALFGSPAEWFSTRVVPSSSGTCCKSDYSLCVIPPHMIQHRYAMMPNIPCPPVVDPPDDET